MDVSGVNYVPRRQNKMKKFITVIIFIIFLILTAVGGFSLGSVITLIYPDKLPVESFKTNIVPIYEDISLSIADDSIILKGWRFYKKEHTKVVILSHDYGKNRLQFGVDTIDLAKKLIDNKYDVILFDYRNHGQSEGEVSSFGFREVEDLNAVVDYANKKDYEEINILGFGMGANIALDIMESRDDIASIIVDSPSNSFEEIMQLYINKTEINKIYPLNKIVPYAVKLFTGSGKLKSQHFENIEKIIPGKVMFIHGGKDDFIDKAISKKYFTKITENYPYNAKYLEIEGASYLESYLADPVLYMDNVLEFLNE